MAAGGIEGRSNVVVTPVAKQARQIRYSGRQTCHQTPNVALDEPAGEGGPADSRGTISVRQRRGQSRAGARGAAESKHTGSRAAEGDRCTGCNRDPRASDEKRATRHLPERPVVHASCPRRWSDRRRASATSVIVGVPDPAVVNTELPAMNRLSIP